MTSFNISPKESARFIVEELADHVTIDKTAVKSLARKLNFVTDQFDVKKWKSDNPLHPQIMNEQTVDWIFLIDSLNFSFWPEEGKEFTIENEVGYWALCAAIQRALRNKVPIISSKFYSQITLDQAKQIFKTDDEKTCIPMLQERVEIMRENGNILIKNFNGTFVDCVQKCNNSALKLLELIYSNFPSFRDDAFLKGNKVSFLKRAQILIADVWACFEGKGLGLFNDINQLTIFADYRIPQILHHFGILQYSDKLKTKLFTNSLLLNGEQFEVEIRGASIHAIELVKKELKNLEESEKTKNINSILIDYYLWGYRRRNCELIDKTSPFHRVRCVYY